MKVFLGYLSNTRFTAATASKYYAGCSDFVNSHLINKPAPQCAAAYKARTVFSEHTAGIVFAYLIVPFKTIHRLRRSTGFTIFLI
jgi:hypothetical protein